MHTGSSQPYPAPELPAFMTVGAQAAPVYYLNTAPLDLRSADSSARVHSALFDMLCRAFPEAITGQALIKVHIGEPRCTTRLRPEYTPVITRFLRSRGARSVVAGDSTVAYTGPRGHRQNPSDDVFTYRALADRHGWSAQGPAAVPFVVLDRPCSAIPGIYEFTDEHCSFSVTGIERYRDFSLAGGCRDAGFIVNNAHLTLHGLAGLAGCIKSLAMGCAGLAGKLRMHQFLLPGFNADTCIRCGICIANCPEKALLEGDEDAPPRVIEGTCIGCGECVSLCPAKAVELFGKEINDWSRGEDTLPLRMADYTIGLMNGRWGAMLHVLHMYAVTHLCDCVDRKQKPFIADMGFLVGKNPFAVDRAGAVLLRERLGAHVLPDMEKKISSADVIARYVEKRYGIAGDGALHTLTVGDTDALP